MDWWYFPQFLVENVCIQEKEFRTFCLKLFFFRGQRWIRTTEGVSQQIYSLPHLATLVFARLQSQSRPLELNCVAKIWFIFETAKRNQSFLSQ